MERVRVKYLLRLYLSSSNLASVPVFYRRARMQRCLGILWPRRFVAGSSKNYAAASIVFLHIAKPEWKRTAVVGKWLAVALAGYPRSSCGCGASICVRSYRDGIEFSPLTGCGFPGATAPESLLRGAETYLS
jgi:hypothetical protein